MAGSVRLARIGGRSISASLDPSLNVTIACTNVELLG